MVAECPTEVWLRISQFLPDDVLRNMLGVNRLFFDIAMDIRYHQVSLTSIISAKIFRRLSDQAVARRVRKLYLGLDWDRSGGLSRHSSTNTSILKKIRASLGFGHVNHSTRNRAATGSGLLSRPSMSFQELLEGLPIILPIMSNLEEFIIGFFTWPKDFDLEILFLAAWPNFGANNLRKVSLGGNLEGFKNLIASKPPFGAIQELDLEFTDKQYGTDLAMDAIVLLDFVAPLINSLGADLRSLKLWSWASVDLSVFLKQLGKLPKLHRIDVRAAFNRSFIDDPSGLTQLIHSSSPTLRELELRLNPTGFNNPETEARLSEWLYRTIHDNEAVAMDLHTLQLYPSGSAIGFDALLVCIRRSSYTLKKLVVRDHYLQFEEINRIIGAFSSKSILVSLRMNIWRLNTSVINLLAMNLPCLEELTLYIEDIESDESTSFKTALEACSYMYKDWGLYDIGIWQGGSEMDSDIMLSIAKSIPSLRSFWGRGHT